MQIYNYHPETGEYVGISIADESPLEPGVYLIPAHATDIEPPTPGENQRVTWQDGTWVLQNIPVQMYCYYNNGLSYKVVDSNYIAQSEEILFLNKQTENELLVTFPDYTEALKQQKINELRVEYEPQFQELYFSWVAGTVQGDLDNVNEDIAILKAEYTAKLEAINNG